MAKRITPKAKTTRKPVPRRTVDDVYEAILENKTELLGLREDFLELTKHVNDEVQLLHESYDTLRSYIALKQDQTSLLSSVLFQALNNRGIRWALGTIAVSVLATASAHWIPWVEYAVQFFRFM